MALHSGGYYGPDIIIRYQLCVVPLFAQDGIEWRRYLAIDPDHVEDIVDVTWLIFETITDHLSEYLDKEDREYFPYWNETVQAMAFPALDDQGIEELEELLSFILKGPVGPILTPRNGAANWDDSSWHRTQNFLEQPTPSFEIQEQRVIEPPQTRWLREPSAEEAAPEDSTLLLDAAWRTTETDLLKNPEHNVLIDLDETVTDWRDYEEV